MTRIRFAKKLLTGLTSLLFIVACSGQKPLLSETNALPIKSKSPSVKNIIFMIGDGMGLVQMSTARIQKYGPSSKLNIEKMPVAGIVHTHAIDNLITDSAASATALATGYKTRNGMIAMLPDLTRVRTLLEAAADVNKSTGIVATSSITHATPASFCSHVVKRKMQPQIAEQLITSPAQVMLGAGLQFFQPMSTAGSVRRDDRDLVAEATSLGWQYAATETEMNQVSSGKLLGLFAPKAMTGLAGEPTIAEMTSKSIELLNQNDSGFFLMVEGSQIDWGGHDNDADYVVREMLAFDEAVKTAVEFATEDGETLVIVTADHETGGMALNGGDFSGDSLKISWASDYHSGVPVGVFAFGPESLRFTGVFDNIELPLIIDDIWDLPDFPQIIPE